MIEVMAGLRLRLLQHAEVQFAQQMPLGMQIADIGPSMPVKGLPSTRFDGHAC